jgi:CHAT domain
VLSLARAFLEAGAHAVIGTRWPIRDQDAAAFFDAFYRRLGEGASLSEALRRAKADSIEAGRPAAVWASVVILGNGDFRPFSQGRAAASLRLRPTVALSVIAALLLALTVFRAVSQRRRRSAA